MTELATLARPYAEAAFKRAKETDSKHLWSDSLAFLACAVQVEELSSLIANPRVSDEKLAGLLIDICQGQVHEEGVSFLKILMENERLKLVPQISEIFEEYKADDEGYVNVEVLSAYALSKAEETAYIEQLESLLGKKINANVTIDRSLLGGVIAKAGDKVIDSSINGRLNQLAKQL